MIQIPRVRASVSSLPFTSPIPNDNGGTWFLASYRYPAKYLEGRFQSHMTNIGSILYERTGGIVQAAKKNIYIQIQLATNAIVWVDFESKEPVWKPIRSYAYNEKPWPEWGVEVCLEELGVTLKHAVPASDVLSAFHLRGRA